MNFKKALLLFGAVLVFTSFAPSSAQAQWVRIGVGVPAYRPYPYYLPYARPYYPYRYRGYVAPALVFALPPPAYYYPRTVPMPQQSFYGDPLPSAVPTPPQAEQAPGTPPTLIPPPPPQPGTSTTSPDLVPPTLQPIPSPPNQPTGTGL
jgi:hypothetical protein